MILVKSGRVAPFFDKLSVIGPKSTSRVMPVKQNFQFNKNCKLFS